MLEVHFNLGDIISWVDLSSDLKTRKDTHLLFGVAIWQLTC